MHIVIRALRHAQTGLHPASSDRELQPFAEIRHNSETAAIQVSCINGRLTLLNTMNVGLYPIGTYLWSLRGH
jgi:hypothetical protein